AIRFMAGATAHYDSQYDAFKFFSSNTAVPSLSTLIDSADASINSLPPLFVGTVIPLRALVGATGTYTISRDSVWTLPISSCLILEDRLTGIMTDLSTTMSYTFNIQDTTQAPRFLLHIGAGIQKQTFSASCPNASNGSAIAAGIGTGPFSYTWKDSQNHILQVHNNITGNDTLHSLIAGTYQVIIGGNTGYCGTLNDTFAVTAPSVASVFTTITNVTCPAAANGNINVDAVIGGTSPYTYSWSNHASTASIGNLNPGTYTLILTDAQHCIDTNAYTVAQSSLVHAMFTVNADTLYLNTSGQLICSNYSQNATSYLWNFGDASPQSLNPNPIHSYLSPGVYHITLMSSDNNCSDTTGRNVVVLSAPAGIKGL
ncbi:MAG TPA: PKD domain-containing protein, partial [Bacteroidia bacterium]|nr:PKD domain-containing protein [Bacteroidia bacterium]